MADSKEITRFFTAMGDETRLQIVTLLQGKPLNVGEIAALFAISRPAISHHLRVLKDANVVTSEKTGQEVYYCINADYIVRMLRTLANKLEQRSESE
jgi:ArsR family transcriptional regulator